MSIKKGVKMDNITFYPVVETLKIFDPFVEVTALKLGVAASGWTLTKQKGNIAGVTVRVSGAGAYARMSGSMSFSMRRMESSSTYNEMVKQYSISGGVSGFWDWLGIGSHATTYKSEIQRALTEMSQSVGVRGTVNIDLYATGLYSNIPVTASAYIMMLQITDDQGSSFEVFSNASPNTNTGAIDQNGNILPVKENNSSITI